MSQSLPSDPLPPNAIAVVGMAGRFPGANSISAFWDNLRRGEESIVTLSEDELLAAGISEKTLTNPSYVRRAALMEGIDEFDPEFFGFPPQVARTMDPQQRLFLQCAWHALEDAGCDPAEFDGLISVYGTSAASIYMMHNLLSHHDPKVIMGEGASFDLINMSLWNDKDYLATRVSHQFDLRGPSVTVQTACSSSLVAVHSACQSLLSGESDMALAGGVSIRVPHRVGYWHEPGSMVSPQGRCRPFDAAADGTVFGSGVAIVALKLLQTALDDGDRIHAVIRGSAINNDGSKKMTYAAPNGAAQADVIAEAQAVAGIDSSTVSYVETHGTGTPLGDPIEIDGLRKAFAVSAESRPGPCAVGSVKSNIGHLGEASGIAGLIKTILCLENRAIPATLHYSTPNPALELDRGPFVVQSEYGEWKWDGIRRAGVSSFGVGGTNVHVVVEEAPAAPASATRPGPQVLRLSARTSEALDDYRSALATELSRPDAPDLADVAHTLAGRRQESVRLAAVVHDHQNAAAVLRAAEHDNVFVESSAPDAGASSDRVALLFPGQGAQHAEMARGLYDAEPVFAEHFDLCAAGFDRELGIDLRAEVFNTGGTDLERTDRAQPALFAVEYALGMLLASYGVRPAMLAGHSIGEYAAATLAGVFDVSTAIRVVATRARLMHASAPGAMVAVAMSPDLVADDLSPGLDLAAVNDPANCVVAGSPTDIRGFVNRLREKGIVARRVRTAHAFHSNVMDPVVPEFAEFLSKVELHAPHTPLLSNVTGTWMTAEEATDPAFWARQIRATVRFSDELDLILDHPHRVLIEVGPGGTLTGSAIRHPKWSSGDRAVRLMRHQAQNRSDHDTFLLALGQLWSAGIELDWTPLTAGAKRVSVAGYPFARQRYWIDPKAVEWTAEHPGDDGSAAGSPNGGASQENAGRGGRSEIEATLQRIVRECLGVASVGLHDNFFEVGGDSLIAIGVAMSATNQGLDLTPQDLYEHQSVSALAAALVTRYAAGGLANVPSLDDVNPPVPPNVAHFLQHGLRDIGRWRVPVALRLDSGVSVEDVQSVLTAVANHHDALRLQISERAGVWEQQIDAPYESVELVHRSLAEGLSRGSAQEREAILDVVERHIGDLGESGSPFSAIYIVDYQGNPRCLAMVAHEMVVDTTSREILLTDFITAFTQRLAGEDIALPPATTSWREWSHRCATLATHPAVLDSRDYWLEASTKATMQVADPQIADRPAAHDLVRMPLALTSEQTDELDRARRRFQFTVEEVLLAALGRSIAHTLGEGVIAVNLAGDGRSVLKPAVDPRRSVGGFSTIYPVALRCVSPEHADAMGVLGDVHDMLDAVPHHGIGHGLLRYNFAPTARLLGPIPPPDIYVCNEGMIPELPVGEGPVQFDLDVAKTVRDKVPGLGHAIELRAYRAAGVLHCDWWYDSRRIPRHTVEALVDHFPLALTELVAQALASSRAESGGATLELDLVDLSAE